MPSADMRMRNVSTRIADLSAEKRALLATRLKEREEPSSFGILPRPRGQPAPLSFAQERLWFLSQLAPESSFYNEAGAVKLDGELDVDALDRSIKEIVRRHEVLRTTFVTRGGRPQQLIAPEPQIGLKHVDLQGWPAQERMKEAQRRMMDEAQQPFDLTVGPLMQAMLIRLAPEEHILALMMHHIVADGWSIGVLVRELGMLYSAFCSGRPSPLPELPIQYADYACWQRERLQGAVFEKQLAYWTKQLESSPPVLELPTDSVRPPVLRHSGARYFFDIPQVLTASLRRLSKTHGVTLFMTLATAFAVFLHRYTGQRDICIGYPVANRTRAELRDLIGFFANTLILRADLSDNPHFVQLLLRVRDAVLGAQVHQDLPFEVLVDALRPVRDTSHSPLFQVMLVFQNATVERLELPGVEPSPIEVETGGAKFDVTLSIREEEGALRAWFEYNTELFCGSTMACWASHYHELLEGVLARREARISDLPLLTEAERRRLLIEWNATEAGYPQEKCLHQLSEEQVAKMPEAVAVVYKDQALTYAELNARANQLAHHLHNSGVGPEVPVGICMERSLELVVGILGILKAGGAYVPIDPSYPKERIAHVLEDARPKAVLTQEALRGLLPVQARRLFLDTRWQVIAGESADDPVNLASPQNLAYVIYTSGSTGRPKGVEVTHRNAVHSTSARLGYYRAPVSGFLLLSSMAFDSSVAGLFGTLCQGGRLVLPPEGTVLDPKRLSHLILSRGISHVLAVPSLYEAVLEQITPEEGASLRTAIVAGEPCRKGEVDLHRTRLPQAELFNEYGPTEATVWSTVYRCEAECGERVPIGRPIVNTRLYVLDGRLEPVPIGVEGELYIGGAGITRGYRNHAALTAEQFVPDPFGTESGRRLYKTGDRVRYLADGDLEFLGRIDRQVKIRGYRIELGEIEVRLTEHPQVKEAVVVVREDTHGDKRLVGYLVGEQSAPTVEELRAHLKEGLPEYMVPAALVFLDALPLTPNGKVDRKALPAPEIGSQLAHRYVAPRTPTEEILAGIWAEVLGVERVGIYDNFFELGGHSLLASQVVARVIDVLDEDLPLMSLFESPTIAALAAVIAELKGAKTLCNLAPLVKVSREGEVPLSFAQQRLWFLAQLDGTAPTYHVAGAVRLQGSLQLEVLERSINEIVRRHEVLRTTFPSVEGRARQVVAPALMLSIRLLDLTYLPRERLEIETCWSLEEDARRPFDLSHGPLLRLSLLRLGAEEHVLGVVTHHIVSDGWSIGVLIREFVMLYESFRAGRPSPLIDLPVQYADYAVWQRGWLQGEVLERQLAYWKGRLEGAPPVLELPTDRSRPAVQSHRGAAYRFTVSCAITEQLKALSRQEGVTLFMVLLAAFQVLLSRYSGQRDICVGTPIANRNRVELEGLIGFFVNTLVSRTDLSGNPPFTELLKRVREVCLGAQAHQDLPFEKLVEELAPVRDMSHSPLFQVMLVLQNTSTQERTLPGLRVQGMAAETETAKFDLTFDVFEQDNRLEASFEYASDLFDKATIARLAHHFGNLLQGIVAAPETHLSELPLLTEPERQRLLGRWNTTDVAYPQDRCIHQLFEEQAEQTPEACAVVCGGERLTYRALNVRANRVAQGLRKLGVGPDTLVGLLGDRGIDFLVLMLGIFKAGGAYVPLDPAHPDGRMRQVLEESRVGYLLCADAYRARAERLIDEAVVDPAPRLVSLTDVEADATALSNPPRCDTERNLAFVIYTSGSTGKPKGAMVEHRGMFNNLITKVPALGLTERDVIAQTASQCFDISVWQYLTALTCGARVEVFPDAVSRDPARLITELDARGVTILETVPSMIGALLEIAGEGTALAALRWLIPCGEAFPPELCRRWMARFPAMQLLNAYGPAECSDDVSYHPIEKPKDDDLTVPIGRPVDNTRLYLLDRWCEPVPIGVAGEICVGGIQVGRGYLNRPDLTGAVFIPDPFGAAGERLYRTGDLGRYRGEGVLEFLGRIDHQVKIRGYRIEPGEIEACLVAHPEVREACVVAHPVAEIVYRLVAYVVGDVREVSVLRAHILNTLPDYMVPAAFVFLEALPLTPNGKVDRKAMPVPDLEGQLAHQYVAPRNGTEEILAGIWAEVLGVEHVGIHDNFFELGGHSLLAVTVIERLRRAGCALDVRALFTTPTVAGLADRVGREQVIDVPPNRIAPDCAAITPELLPLVTLSQAEIDRIVAQVPGGVRNIQDIYPLAPLQEGILFHHLLETEGDVYLYPTLLGFDTRARLWGFLQALRAVIARHDILCTAVVWEGLPEVVQVVWRDAPLVVEEVTLDGSAGAAAEQLRARFDPRHYRLDVRQAPLLRGFMAEETPGGRWLLLLMEHHLALDHTASEIVVEEVLAHLMGHGEQLPAPLPFRNFVVQARLGVSLAEHETFFRELLGDVDEPTAPFGLLDVQGDGSAIEEGRLELDAGLARGLRRRARHLGVSAASLCHLAWALVLGRVSGREDVVFGTVLFGRMQGGEGADRVLGMFINTLPVRIRLGGEGVAAAVRRTHVLLADLLRHEHASLALAQRCSGVVAPTPLFSALFNYRYSVEDTHSEDTSAWAGMDILLGEGRTNYPISLSLDDLGEGFSLTAQVQRPLEPQRICGYLQTALSELVAALETAPSTALRSLDILPEPERQRLLVEWNTTDVAYPEDRSIHQLFEEQAERTPEACAVVFEDRQLTYAELNAKSNQLAHYMRAQGVGPEVLVGICVERSLEMVIGVLGVLKAGGAYLPLDPTHPKERLAYMLHDAQPRVLLTQSLLRDALPAHPDIVCLDTDWSLIARRRTKNLANLALPLNLAYVIYTSGSTGRPKGVAVTGSSIANYLSCILMRLHRESALRFAMASSIVADLGNTVLFGSLCSGGCLHVLSVDVATDRYLCSEYIDSRSIDVLKITPSHFRALYHPDSPRNLVPRTAVVFGGESLPSYLANTVKESNQACHVLNHYGPTEATVGSLLFPASDERENNNLASAVPIGRPIANTQAYVLDHDLNPVPVGVNGELYLGGVQLARGYLKRPELTAERFIPHPFSDRPGERLYQTGDLARCRPEGNIEYLGRIDHQVKIRGFRIELGEIEAKLTEQPQVKEAVVIAREDTQGDKRLVGYVVGEEPAPTVEELRAHLKEGLPEYMVPAALVFLDALPLIPNGKVDRKALPALEIGSQLAHRYVAPRTPTEEIVASIWAEVLKLERVGVQDNFFDLGGHSLLATQVVSRVRQAFDVDLPLRDLFKAPTVAALAQTLEKYVLAEIATLDESEAECALRMTAK